MRREYGGPDVFLSEKHLEAFAVILPAHLHPKDEAFKAANRAVAERMVDGASRDYVLSEESLG